MANYTLNIPDTAPIPILAKIARVSLSTHPGQIDPEIAALEDSEVIKRWTVRMWGAAVADAIQQQAQASVTAKIQAAQDLLAETTISTS